MPDLAVCNVCGLHSFGIPHELSYSFAPLHLFDGSKDLWFYVILFFSLFLVFHLLEGLWLSN